MAALTELPAAECERLLGSAHIGRFALVTPQGPQILPVNYAVRDGAVVVRTSPSGLLARYGTEHQVAFEVDIVNEEYGSGWSVLARGPGILDLNPPGRDSVALGTVPRPWADGDRRCEFRLPWTQITGRRLGSGARA